MSLKIVIIGVGEVGYNLSKFLSKEDYNLLVYIQTSVFNPNEDSGICYISFGKFWEGIRGTFAAFIP